MIEINIGATIVSNGREIGRIERVILDRNTFEVTHLVARHGSLIHLRHILVPLAWVVDSTHDRVRTDRSESEFEALPNFETQHYVSLDHLDEEQWEHPRSKIRPTDWINYLVPLVANALGDPYHSPGIVVTNDLMTPAESSIQRGLPVESNDGHRIGEILEVLLTKPDWRLTAVIISRGLVRPHPLRVPADWIAIVQHDRIVLNRSKHQFEDWASQSRESVN